MASAKPKQGVAVDVNGFWDAPGGRVALKNKDGHVLALLVHPNEGVALKASDKVLDGTLEEDNLTADVRLGILTPKCAGTDETAFAVLLVTRSGKLTGGISAKAPCAAGLSSVTLHRVNPAAGKPETAGSPAAAVRAAEPAPDDYDPLGRRAKPLAGSVKALLTDGKQYMDEGQFEKAREQFERALGVDPKIGETYNGIGATFALRNDYDTAIDWYKRGLEAAPGFGDIYYNMACAYAQRNKAQLALRYLKLAATKGYTEISALDADHDLDPIRDQPGFRAIRDLMVTSAPHPAP
jgi:tetratricopeptide (TPR) repeat protein